jgi:Flp pilus assembly protein TadG
VSRRRGAFDPSCGRRFGRLRGIARDQEGVVAVIVALFMVVILVLAALVIDLGALYDHDRELQAAADAAALAGAQELIYSKGSLTAASAKAVEYVSLNADVSSVEEANLAPWSPVVDLGSVTVDLRENRVKFSFAPIIGQTEGSVTAHAKAELKYLVSVNSVAPVALLLMNPERFRFVFKSTNGTRVGSFDIVDSDGDGTFGESGEGGGTLPAGLAAGLYEVTLQAIGTVDGQEQVGLELPDIGLFRVSNPSDPKETLYRVGMSRSGGTIYVQAVVAPTVQGNTLQAELGKNRDFTLYRQGATQTFAGSISAPTGTDNNTGYGTHDLEIKVDKKWITCGRYVAFNDDVPLKYLMMEPSFYAGYSRQYGESDFQRAEIVTEIPHTGDGKTYVMKLGNQAGSGLYSGNWRLADIYAGHNTREEIAVFDTTVLDTWKLNYPLVIGGPLKPEPGASTGQVIQGMNDRIANSPDDEAWRYVLVPFVDYAPDLAGSSRNYTIRAFAAFYIFDFKDKGNDKGEITGQFIRWLASGEWSDTPSGPLYVETAVLTE